MDSDAGSSLARRRHCLSPPFFFFSSFFVSFVHFLHVFLLYLGFISSSFTKSCASCRTCHIQASWLLLLISSPTPATTAMVVLDLTFEGCVCNALSSSPKVAVQPDLHISSSLLAMTSLSTGKIYFSLPHRELSFLVGVLRRSFTRSTSTFCSEFYSSSSVANRTFPEDPKTNPLSRPLPFSATKSGVCSYSLSKTDSGNKRFNYGFINALWLRYGNIGVRSRFLAKDSAFPPNPVKHLCFYTGLKVARATSSDSSIIHRHLVSEALYPIALSHMSPWCRPKLAISSSRVCSVSSPNLRLLKLQSCSPLRLYSADKFIKSSSRQDQERSLSTSSFSEERTFPPPLLSMRDRHIPIEISEKLFNSFTVLLSRVSVYTEPEDATRLVFVMCSGGKGWFSTSQCKVTMIYESGFTVNLPTHLSSVSFSLSISSEELSVLTYVVFKFHCCNQRGWIILSSYCMFEV
ncbi:unnamed protein product [Brassica oleracea var. botrytis]